MTKLRLFPLIFLVSCILLIGLSSASFGYNKIPTAEVNNNTINVNNSAFWGGYTPATLPHNVIDNLEWSVAGHIMDTDLDMNGNDITARNGEFTTDLDVDDDLTVFDVFEVFGSSYFNHLATFYHNLLVYNETDEAIIEIESGNSTEPVQLRLLQDGTNDLYIYTYGSSAEGTYYGLPRANSSYVDAQGERLIIGTFNTGPMYLASDRDARFILTSDGDLIPYDDEYYDIGNRTLRIKDIYVLGEDGEGGLHFVEDDGSYGNLSMDDDMNLLWNGLPLGNSTFNQTILSEDYVPFNGSTSNLNMTGYNITATFIGDGSYLTGLIGSSLGSNSSLWNVSGTDIFPFDLSKNLGIGTITPERNLHIKGTATTYAKIETTAANGIAGLELENDAQKWLLKTESTDNFIIRDVTGNTNPFNIAEGGAPTNSFVLDTTRLTINLPENDYDFVVGGDTDPNLLFCNAGTDRVGIGTATPLKKLHLQSTNDDGIILESTTASNDNDQLQIKFLGTNADYPAIIKGYRGSTSTKMGLRFDVSAKTEAMVIDENGNVGIKTADQTADLHVLKAGTIKDLDANTVGGFQNSLVAGSLARLAIIGGNAGYSILDLGDTDSQFVAGIQYNHALNQMNLRVNGGNRIEITGVTTTVNNDLEVTGDADITGNLIVQGNATYNGYYGGMWFHNISGTPMALTDTYLAMNYTNSTSANGFEFIDHGTLQLKDDGGKYQVNWKAGGTGVNNHIYNGCVFVNDVCIENTIGHTVGQQSNFVQLVGFGFIDVDAYDNVTVRIRDVGDTTPSGKAIISNVNLVRVGD